MDQGDADGVIADATKMIELNPQGPEGYMSRGSARAKKKDYNGAIDDYTKAIALNQKSADAYRDRASAHSKASNLPEMSLSNKRLHLSAAIGDANKAIQLNPGWKNDLDDFLAKARAKLTEMDTQ